MLSAPVAEVWRRLIDANELAAIVPGCRRLTQDGPDRYSAEVVIGVAGIRGTYDAQIEMRDKREPHSVRLIGKASGALGFGSGSGFVTLVPEGEGRTRLEIQLRGRRRRQGRERRPAHARQRDARAGRAVLPRAAEADRSRQQRDGEAGCRGWRSARQDGGAS